MNIGQFFEGTDPFYINLVLIKNNFILLMDPRPYNYEFRRPRPNNPTYQSYNAYDSLYHMGKKQFLSNNILRDEYSPKMNIEPPAHQYHTPNYQYPYQYYLPHERQDSSSQVSRTNNRRYEEVGVNTENKNSRSGSNYSQRSKSSASSNNVNNVNPSTHRTSVLSTYGSNSIQQKEIDIVPPKKDSVNLFYGHNDTSQVFKKQQRPFNIINMYSRHTEPLRKYPKLTRQNLLYQQGMDVIGAE